MGALHPVTSVSVQV